MAAPIIIPFDNNPASTSIKTTSYTIPNGKFARVRDMSGDLTLDNNPVYFILTTKSVTTSSNQYTYFYYIDNEVHDFVIFSCSSTISNAGNLLNLYSTAGCINSADNTLSSIQVSTVSSNASFTGNRTIKYFYGNRNIPLSYGALTAAAAPIRTLGSWSVLLSRSSGTVGFSLQLCKSVLEEFWIPSGSVLSGTKYLVTEYNNIS